MPPNSDKPRCLLCGVNASFRHSAICKSCHEIVRGRGQMWCNVCKTAVARADWQASGCCRSCHARRAAARYEATRAPQPACALCHERSARAGSAICQACRAALRATGRAWCSAGRHAVAATSMSARVSACRACAAATDRAAYAERSPAQTGTCATCNAPLRGHARCNGCTRLLHGDAAKQPLCRLCARDRAAGVPPQGRPWRELESAA